MTWNLRCSPRWPLTTAVCLSLTSSGITCIGPYVWPYSLLPCSRHTLGLGHELKNSTSANRLTVSWQVSSHRQGGRQGAFKFHTQSVVKLEPQQTKVYPKILLFKILRFPALLFLLCVPSSDQYVSVGQLYLWQFYNYFLQRSFVLD